MEPEFDEACGDLRQEIRQIGDKVRGLMSHGTFQKDSQHGGQHGEMKANLMLAFRHLEDARMRLGKAVQAFDGGVSCYDK